ncbi:hypothetical protein F1559_005141 [Cyanidiococcus yangmingshanensis]|uniref:Uncharacterized protein n=1 Tax=Cyanidiococcus yangmingshanensis TaxID=2690220 RepID=A0A7J7ISJ2_9RHOD|nr:hypothetical protein F1559_005141 [Cyanidiococcus yangmingshanensis]
MGNGTNGLINRTWYNTALAGAISGAALVAHTPFDMQIELNSAAPWHFDPYTTIDPLTAPHEIDLATTILRQIAVGLGFSGTITADSETKTARYGLAYDTHYGYPAFSVPGRFDSLLVDAAGCGVITACQPYGGAALYSALTTLNNIFIQDVDGNPFMLFSPDPYNPATNTYQFSPTTWLWDCVQAGFQTVRCSSLVTPYAVPGEQNYNIGANTLAIMAVLMSNRTLPSPAPAYCTAACTSDTTIAVEAIAAFQDFSEDAAAAAAPVAPAVTPSSAIMVAQRVSVATSLMPRTSPGMPVLAPVTGTATTKTVFVPTVPVPLPSTSGVPRSLLPSCDQVRKAYASALQDVLHAYNFSNSAVAPVHCRLDRGSERYLLSASIVGLDHSAVSDLRATLLDSVNTTGVLIAASMQIALGTSLSLDPVAVVRLYERTGVSAPVLPPPVPLQTALQYAGAFDVHWRLEAAPGTVVNQTTFCSNAAIQSLIQSATITILELSISKTLNTSVFGIAELSLIPERSECALYRGSPNSAPPAKYDLLFSVAVARSATNLQRSAAFVPAASNAAQTLASVDVTSILRTLAPRGLYSDTVFVHIVYNSFTF